MRVFFLNRFFYPDHSATSQMLTDLAFYLAGKGWQVSVICSRQRYDDPAALLPVVESVNGVTVHRVRTSRFGRYNLAGRAFDYLSYYFSAGWRLWRLTRPGDVVVAKTDPPLISVVAGWIVRLRRARLVNWLQDLFPEVAIALGVRGMSGALGRWLVRRRNASLRSAKCNVVLGELMAQHLFREGVPERKVRAIPNWADGEAVRPLPHADNPLRAAWELEGMFVVGYSGNLGRAHEFQTFLNAADLLRDESRIRFLFIGGGPLLPEVQDEVEARGLNNVTFKPYQPREKLRESLGVPDIHLAALRPVLEGLIVPSKFYGIAAAGRPTLFIGDPEGEVPRQLRTEKAGLSFPAGDAQGVADALRFLSRDSGLCLQMGANARALFERDFSRHLAFEAWEDLLSGVSCAG